ncbi:UNKNOWN [Stylonychia lemnae]|uniref:Uncharacterized protein n=1 Tax=Stylonychia lemnae TaxID=5949 RepID=A0A078B418_STYLE|nr:UNKNOWN [Stylonychia lemnae]|eukprot:CDW88986.1 UNKNOWN [Stylonychia lemnae]
MNNDSSNKGIFDDFASNLFKATNCTKDERGEAAWDRENQSISQELKRSANKVVHCPDLSVEHGSSDCDKFKDFKDKKDSQ